MGDDRSARVAVGLSHEQRFCRWERQRQHTKRLRRAWHQQEEQRSWHLAIGCGLVRSLLPQLRGYGWSLQQLSSREPGSALLQGHGKDELPRSDHACTRDRALLRHLHGISRLHEWTYP